MRWWVRIATHLATVCVVAISSPAIAQKSNSSESSIIGRSVRLSAQDDVRGVRIELAQIDESKLVVVAFLGIECPLAKQYAARIQELSESYDDRVSFIGIFSNQQDSPDEIARYADELGLRFPALLDPDGRIADEFSASRTPEVFLLDRQRNISYHGRVDDQFDIGVAKSEPSRRYLEAAITDVLANRAVETPETDAVGCLIGRTRIAVTEQPVTFAADVASILQRHCIACHQPGQIGPMSFTEVDEVLGWAAMIDEVVREERMPPWHANPHVGRFANERRLSEDERRTIAQWVASGAAVGDRSAIPKISPRPAGWQLPTEPDLVIPVSSQPIAVPATGELDYQHFVSEYEFKTETWLQAVQILPGNSTVVHHILAFVDTEDGRQTVGDLEGIDGYVAGYVPGLTIEPFPKGMAKRIPAGSHLVFQVHYTPIGTPQTDHSRIGMVFADSDSVQREVVTTSAIRRHLEIPAGESAHQVTAYSHRSLAGGLLLGMMPHMHLRGKSFRYELQSTNGATQPLLDVPHYDFHWQSSYRLIEPILLEQGDTICCVAQFDNSAENPNNPDPRQVVRWGDQTREEMMIGYFEVAIERSWPELSAQDLKRHVSIVEAMDRFDTNRDGVIEQVEVPQRTAGRFTEFDQNGDRRVTFAELAQGWTE